jgi:hypothetical protein
MQHPEATFEQFWHEVLQPYENALYYAQVSPRHFEAAATKTLQIMYEGRYSGIFQPQKHYVALKKDFSNIEEVVQSLSNKELIEYITESAFQDIILNEAYSYDRFINNFDEKIRSL